MNLMHLRYFMKLAEIQNYTLTASELYITQPGLSSAVNSLEEELGIRLFEKKGRNVHLTKYGMEFYRYVDQSLKVLDAGISVAQEHSGKLNGVIEIGCIDTIISDYLATVIHNFRQKYPKIQFKVYQSQTEAILSMMESRSCDIGLCSFDTPVPNISAVPILTQEVVAVVYKHHPLAARGSIVMADLADYPILTYTLAQQIGQRFRKLICEKLPGRDPVNIRYEFPSELYTAGILFQEADENGSFGPSGRSVGLLAKVPYLTKYQDLVLLPIRDVPRDYRTIYMIYDNQEFKTHATMLFVNFIRDHYSLEKGFREDVPEDPEF
ncbi:MAG: LysR family transcriptional regulator [Lachnospiraceae bacterium]|nr:LysR family transcriptional regulator [Lachnospiraceae bacterium]